MKRTTARSGVIGVTGAIALWGAVCAAAAAGCSSSATGLPDAAPGHVGSGGGNGGAGGGGGSSGGGGSCMTFSGAVGAACVNVSNHDPCTTEPPCFNTCGPLKSGVKNCACAGGAWQCPTCEYDPDPGKTYACYRR